MSVASLQPIGTYDGLEWANFNVIDIGSGITGIKAQSSPNVATQYVLSSGLSPTASLQTTGNTQYFALNSFYFGCVLSSQETLAGLPTSCSLTVTGKRSGKTVATQDISFTPQNLVTSNMQKQTFSGKWLAVDEVVFEQTELLSAAISVLYDDVDFTLFSS